MQRGEATYGTGIPARRLPSDKVVRAVLIAAAASTAIHYTDNLVNIDEYPQPHWINEAVIPIAWVLLTAVGVAGYVLFRRGQLMAAGLCLFVYSYTALSSLGHYWYGSMSEFTTKMHAGIWLDGATGAAVLVVAVWLVVAGVRRRT